MKFYKYFFFALAAGWFGTVLTSCGEDDESPIGDRPITELVYIVGPTIDANGTFTVQLTGNDNGSPLSSITIERDGDLVDDADITIDGSPTVNPIPLTGGLQSIFDVEIEIQTDLQEGEFAEYLFTVEAEDGSASVEPANIDVEAAQLYVAQRNPTDYLADPDSLITIPIEASPGTGGQLTTMAVYQNDILIDASRVSFGSNVWSNNPEDLDTALQGGFDNEDLVLSAQSAADDTSLYEVVVVDEDLNEASFTFFIVTTGTPVEENTATLLSNMGGPQGQGGVNLITGAEDDHDHEDMHLADQGIDDDLPDPENWLQTIEAGALTTTLRFVQGGGYFDDFEYKEDIATTFEGGPGVDATSGTVSKVVAGDEFILRTDDNETIAVRVDEVVVTDDDNTDHYSLSVKY